MKKSSKQVTQNLKIGGKKRKMDSFKIEQDLRIYQDPSKRARTNLKKKI